MLDQVSSGGPLAGIKVDAAAPDPVALDTDNPRPGAPKHIDDAALASIKALPDVRSVLPVIATPMLIVSPESYPPAAHVRVRDDGRIFDSVIGVDLDRINDLPISLISGRLPAPGSTTEALITVDFLRRIGVSQANAPALVGTELTLGAPRAFVTTEGPRFRARWSRVTIVGIVSQEADSGLVVVPLATAAARRARGALRARSPMHFRVTRRRTARSLSSRAGSTVSPTYAPRSIASASRRARRRHSSRKSSATCTSSSWCSRASV